MNKTWKYIFKKKKRKILQEDIHMNLTHVEELFIIAREKCPFNSIESHDYRQLATSTGIVHIVPSHNNAPIVSRTARESTATVNKCLNTLGIPHNQLRCVCIAYFEIEPAPHSLAVSFKNRPIASSRHS